MQLSCCCSLPSLQRILERTQLDFCKDYVHEDAVTEKCINDQLATLPLIGCYERVYDAAHLVAHKRQLVVRATLSVRSAPPEWADN